MLTFAEEIMLLLLDDEDGVFVPIAESTVECALAGAVLMDLAFANRIDTDLTRLMVVDRTSMGDPLLDGVLARLDTATETVDAKTWVERLSRDNAATIREAALANLVARGILERHDEKFLWVHRGRRYPMIDGQAEREVRLRIIDVLLSDDIPDPRDVALICLADACNILSDVLPEGTAEQARPRIALIRKMDLIGREVASAVTDIERSIVLAVARAPH